MRTLTPTQKLSNAIDLLEQKQKEELIFGKCNKVLIANYISMPPNTINIYPMPG